MPRLILLIASFFLIWLWWSKQKGLDSDERRSFLWRSAFWLLLGISVGLVVTGRMYWVGAAFAALIPLAKTLLSLSFRAFPLLQMLSRFKSSPSQFKTNSLHVTINFSNRKMDGEILKGTFTGHKLSDLNNGQLDALAADLKINDRESYALLYAYRIRSGNAGSEGQSNFNTDNLSKLSRSEAYRVLGLDEKASKEEIIKAHKRLMQRLHPDRGGSDYLAAKINAAKDILQG
ncbi:MAG: DnaJ domain-containing protein [Porticoccaceae bacterium]|nr:DnaJ domain-containing protein [Porticoccaceae bacterium]